MRSIRSAVLAAFLLAIGPLGAVAQNKADAPALPKRPVPYVQLHRAPAQPRTSGPLPAPAGQAPVALSATGPALPNGERLPPGAPLPPAELESFVDGMVRDAMARDHIAGVAVAVVQNGQVLLRRGYGFASLAPQRPVDPDRSLFRVGSISKTFTWIALMKEVEAGRIRLNQPINLYLPEKVQIRDQGYDRPVLVANLMDHSAGFEDRILGQGMERDYKRVRPLEIYLRQERPHRVRSPGVVSSYSNYGAALGGEAAAYTAGKPYERLIEDDILVPLGMAHTSFREPRPARAGLPPPMPALLAHDVVDGYRWTPTGFARRPYEYIGQAAPAGAASSTAQDMARYMLMQLGGGQLDGAVIYNANTAQAFRTPLRRTAPGINGWAHGMMIYSLPGGHRGYGHAGETLSFHSNMVLAPDLGLGIFIATNTDTGGALAERLPVAVVRQFYATPQVFPRAGSRDLTAAGDLFRGYYVTNRRAYSGLEGFVTLLSGGVTVRVNPDGRLTALGAGGGPDIYVPAGPVDAGQFVGALDDSHLAFTLRDGRAVAFVKTLGTELYERAPFWKQPVALGLLAGLTGLAALATLAGIVARNRREFRQNQIQSRASLVQNIQAVLWLSALLLFGLWASKTSDIAEVMYRWPGALLIIASACALVAAVLAGVNLLALPMLWRGGRRVDSWSGLRKALFTLTVLIYGAFSVVLGLWGALSPWS